MKKQTFDLNKMGLSAMTEFEMQEIDGGSFWDWLTAGGFVTALIGVAAAATAVMGVGIIAIAIGLAAGNS
ncbi:MAG: hypothetical protein H7Z13_01505 [Ferruginibacter sp.]|nr:hypothetical protein [Ferruginibacter sp.]